MISRKQKIGAKIFQNAFSKKNWDDWVISFNSKAWSILFRENSDWKDKKFSYKHLSYSN